MDTCRIEYVTFNYNLIGMPRMNKILDGSGLFFFREDGSGLKELQTH